MGRVFGDWLRDTGESISTGWGKFKEIYRKDLIRQGKADRAMSKAMLGAGGEVIDWGQKTGIPAAKQGATWVGDQYADLQKYEKERSKRARGKEKERHDKNVALDGPDYHAKRLKKMGSDIVDTGVNAYDWVSDQAGDVVDFTTGFTGSAYDAATGDPKKPQTALAGDGVGNKPKKGSK